MICSIPTSSSGQCLFIPHIENHDEARKLPQSGHLEKSDKMITNLSDVDKVHVLPQSRHLEKSETMISNLSEVDMVQVRNNIHINIYGRVIHKNWRYHLSS